MCGIAGIVSKNSLLTSNERIQSAIKCLHHRGPDDEGIWINEEKTAALGHSRLSIIDLSKEASQPMKYLDRYRIIHNGELYNYVEIKELLLKKDYRFRSQSDTEVIVAAYDLWGNECLQQFDGMFAFVIWDEKENKLFAARDRFGEKPFFFFYDEEQLLFASEMKSIWNMGVSKEVNGAMLYNFLTISYTTNPSDPQETFYQNIQKLPAASFLTYSLRDRQLQIEKYWQVYPEVIGISEEDAMEQFLYLFTQSIKRRFRSDVSIGTSLSGGLDSSTVVAFCDQQSSNNYSHKCFTASFAGFQRDELKYAETVAKKFGLEHHVTEIDGSETVNLMQEVMRYQEEPISSASALAQYKVFQLAKQNGITVLLDGQGADETLAGYHKYYKWHWQDLYRKKKLKKSNELKTAKEMGINESFGFKNRVAAFFPDFVAGILQTRKSKTAFHHPDFNRDFAFSNKQNFYYATPSGFDLNGALFFNSFVSGLEELLRLADRSSMAHAVEVRLPFLDYSLIEFLFTLPPELKIHNGWTKWILRKSVENILPNDIVWRKDKVGFEPPQKIWMEDRSVQDSIMEGKKKLMQQDVLNSSAIAKKIKPHNAYAANSWDWKYWSASYLFD